MTTLTQEPANDEQREQLARFASDAARKAVTDFFRDSRPTKEGAQRVHGNADFTARIRGETSAALRDLSVTDRYKDEERRSNYAYPKEYKGPKPIEEQINTLASTLGLDPTSALEYAKQLPALPQGAEGWFAVPSTDALAKKHFPDVQGDDWKYVRAILHVFDAIAKRRPFHNWRAEQMTPERLQVTTRTKEAIEQIAQVQKGDILIIAAQLGMRHRGRSTRRARECFVANEYGLGSLIGGAVALTHPERFVRFEELDMDLPGDQFDDPDSSVHFVHAPFLDFNDDRVKFASVRCDHADGHYGSASGFLPQAALDACHSNSWIF